MEDVGVQHLIRDHETTAADARRMAVADALATTLAVTAAKVLQTFALAGSVVPDALGVHVLAVVCDKDRG